MEIEPKDWIQFKLVHKKKIPGTIETVFPNDGRPMYVENKPVFDISSLLEASHDFLQVSDDNEHRLKIKLDKNAVEIINKVSRKQPEVGLCVFVMNRPFSLIHYVESLEEPVIYWSGEDKPEAVLFVELINTYQNI